MRHYTAIFTWIMWLAATAGGLSAQPDEPVKAERDQAPPDNAPQTDGQRDDSPPLTSEQRDEVKGILSKYRASSLTAKEARAINEAFRAAGLHNGPGLQEAIRDAGFEPERIGELDPPPNRPAEGRRPAGPRRDKASVPTQRGEGGRRPDRPGPDRSRGYSVEQATSDRAQLNTIAFDGLAFLTGDLGSCTFLPPGKVADFCGFQYMRDVDTNELGHNTSFVPRAANNVLHILTDAQKAQLVALGREQERPLIDFAYKRFPLIKAFCRQLEGDIPTAGAGLNREAVMKYTADVFEIDGLLSYRRAQLLGGIIRSLNNRQRQYLAKMAFNNSATWPELKDQLDKKSLSHTVHVAVMTYASEMFSWYAGNVEADVYFCPERHATYFGSFYMKDIPAMGNPNYSISTSLTGDSGEAFLTALTEPQRKLVTDLVDQQRTDLNEIVETRRAIATELRRFMKQELIDKDKVLALARRYGELDGEISYCYAKAFAEVGKTLTPEQKTTLLKLRNLNARYTCRGAYLYSSPIGMPEIPNTDFLFAPPSTTRPSASTRDVPSGTANPSFVLRSPEVANGGELPKDYTGDGSGATLPLEWSGAPKGTRSFAVIMHHTDPEGVAKWYWVLYNIPPETKSLPKNARSIGTLGNNSINSRVGYAPPHSKGPGAKTYIYTVYALSEPVKLDAEPSEVSRDVLLARIKDTILASAKLHVVYSRDGELNPRAERKE